MPIFNNILAGASGQGDTGYDIEQSLRFNDDDSPILSRTPSSASNQKTWTWSGWIKRSNLGAYTNFFDAHTDDSNRLYLAFNASDKLEIYGSNSGSNILVLTTSAVYRDCSAFYHIAFQCDTTQASSSNRAKLYVNGEQVTAFDTATYPAQDTDLHVNSTAVHRISSYAGTSNYLDGYLAEVNFIDGTALDASSFGETNSDTNQWVPIEYVGSYGTNGFYLPFSSTELANSFTDSSSSSHTITANGDVTNTRAQKKIGSSSIKFDGTGDYLSCADSSDWDFLPASGYTAEAWYKPTTHAGTDFIIGQSVDGNNYWMLGHEDGAGLRFESYSGGSLVLNITGGEITDTDWHHIAVVRDSNDVEIFKDGTSVATGTTSSTATFSGELRIGQGAAHGAMDGYLDEIRLSNTARYTSSFTPSTTAFTADSNTKLLIHSDFNGGLGADSSGNTNDFSATNLVATDVMTGESPTNNFATLNPLYMCSTSTDADRVYSEGNLRATASATGWKNIATTQAIESGKWYWEVTCQGSYNWQLGIAKTNRSTTSNIGLEETGTYCVYCSGSGTGGTFVNGSHTVDNDYVWAADDVLMCAYDDSTGKFWLGKNGTWFKSGNPATSANPNFTVVAADRGDVYPAFAYYASTDGMRFNLGADSSFQGSKTAQGNQDGNGIGDFYYTPPSGFVALCTDNLPDPSIADPTKHFNTVLYTGDGTTNNAITGVGFQPDLVWYKVRSTTGHNNLYDSVRGVQKVVYSDLTNTEATSTGTQDLYAFGADGFTVGSNFQTLCNTSGETFASWNWKAGGAPTVDNSAGAGATPTAGSVKVNGSNYGSALAGATALIRGSANTEAGFSAVTYVGDGTSSNTFAHLLSQAPELIITKNRDSGSFSWATAWQATTDQSTMYLNTTAASFAGTNQWNSTVPNATVVAVGASSETNSQPGQNQKIMAYCFHSVDGYSKVGSYTGNGSSDGTFIYTGFRPAFVMTKSSSSTGNWTMLDSAREPTNVASPGRLYADLSNSESDGATYDFVSNGFKCRETGGPNNSGVTYIYLAFAESPFKTSNAR